MREVTIERPVTVAKLAEALDCKTFELLAELIKRAVYLAPAQTIDDDALAIELASNHGVILRIVGEVPPEDSASGRPPLPLPSSRQFPSVRFDSGPDPETLSPDED